MFYAGVCKMDITPPVGYRLQGHTARNKISEKVHDPLYLKVLTLFDGKNRIAIITSDLIYFTPDFVAAVKKMVERKIGLPENNLLLTASHTHTGPFTFSWTYSPSDLLSDYLTLLQKKICGGIIEAINREEKANLSWGKDKLNIGVINRRKRTVDGIIMQPNPRGPIDDEVSALKIESKDGILAILFNYACHGTTLSTSIFQVSADYPGVAQRELEKIYPRSIALFTNGCCGDVRPAIIKNGKFAGGDFKDIERMGKLLASEVVKICEQTEKIKGNKVVGTLEKNRFPFNKELLPLNEERLEIISQRYFRQKSKEYSAEMVKEWKSYWQKKLKNKEKIPSFVSGDLQILKIGDITIVGLPGEVMVEIGLRIRKEMRGKVMVFGYANGVLGYIPTKKALTEGGYETLSFLSKKYPAPYSPDMEEKLVKTILKMAKIKGEK